MGFNWCECKREEGPSGLQKGKETGRARPPSAGDRRGLIKDALFAARLLPWRPDGAGDASNENNHLQW